MRILVLFGLLTCVACLKCPSCVSATISNVPDSVRSLVDSALSAFGNQKCNDVLTGPVPEIKEETCQEEQGKVSRCSWYKGVLIIKVPKIGKDLPFRVSKRSCYSAAAAATPDDGCNHHSADKSTEDLSALQKLIDTFSSDVVVQSFKGQRCLYTEAYRRPSSGYSRRPTTDQYYMYEIYDRHSPGLRNETHRRPSSGNTYKAPRVFIIGSLLINLSLKYI